MKLHHLLTLLVVLSISWVPPAFSSDECLSCATNVDECRTGNVSKVQKCNPGNVCYGVNIQNIGDIPYYVRGCGSSNICSVLQSVHGNAYKFCDSCEGDRCNNKVIGGANLSGLKCKFCAENCEKCRTGKTNNAIQCVDGADHCYTEYIQNIGHQPYYRRGCGFGDRCQQQVQNHGNALLYCDTCKEDECNKKSIGPEKITENLECLSCESRDESCRTGEVTTVEKCDKAQGYMSCFADHIGEGVYKRGCSRLNQCKNRPLCKSCDDSKCNNEVIGAKERNIRTCYSCNERYLDGSCNEANMASTTTCAAGEICIAYAHYTESYKEIRTVRGCIDYNGCRSIESDRRLKCKSCRYDLCNSNTVQLNVVALS